MTNYNASTMYAIKEQVSANLTKVNTKINEWSNKLGAISCAKSIDNSYIYATAILKKDQDIINTRIKFLEKVAIYNIKQKELARKSKKIKTLPSWIRGPVNQIITKKQGMEVIAAIKEKLDIL